MNATAETDSDWTIWGEWIRGGFIRLFLLVGVFCFLRWMPLRQWMVATWLGALSVGLWVGSWSWVRTRFPGVEIDEEALHVRTWRGRVSLRWADVTRVVGGWPGHTVEVSTDEQQVVINLHGRIDAETLLHTLRSRVPAGAYQASNPDVRAAGRALPHLEGAGDPFGPLSYRGRADQGRRVPLASLRPEVPVASWLALGWSFVVVLLSGGPRQARALLHHGNASIYWRRVELTFGAQVRLDREGFSSLCGRWRYRAPADDDYVYWEQVDPDTRETVASYRSCKGRGSTSRAPLEGGRHPVFSGLPRWLGGRPVLLYRARAERKRRRRSRPDEKPVRQARTDVKWPAETPSAQSYLAWLNRQDAEDPMTVEEEPAGQPKGVVQPKITLQDDVPAETVDEAIQALDEWIVY